MCQNCGCRKNSFDYTTKFNSESLNFNATEFDVDGKNPVGTVNVRWFNTTQTYHFKAYGMDKYYDTGEKDASQVPNSTKEITIGNIVHSVKRKINAGQSLKFQSLSPADGGYPAPSNPTENENGNGNSDENGNGGSNPPDAEEGISKEILGIGAISILVLIAGLMMGKR